MQCWKPVWAMKNTNLKVTDGKRIMMDPVNNNFLSCNFFWLWHYAASWKAELISGLYHGCSVWCEIRSYRSVLLILDAWLDSPEMILHWLFFQCLHWLCLGLDVVLRLCRGLVALLASSQLSGAERCPSALEVRSCTIWPVPHRRQPVLNPPLGLG